MLDMKRIPNARNYDMKLRVARMFWNASQQGICFYNKNKYK